MQLGNDVKITRVNNAAVAGSTDIEATGVDMSGFDGVLFIAAVGTLTATQVTSLHAQQSDDDGSADAYSDLIGSSVGAMADGDSNKLLVLDVRNPQKRWVRPVLDRATANAVLDGIVAIQYAARARPSVQPASVSKFKAVVGPAEGTP